MRLTEVQISNWRNFRSIALSIPQDATLVCLVGENGTGKSNILEFISAACARFGISAGTETRRGNPLNEPHSARLVLALPSATREQLAGEVLPEHITNALPSWDGTLVLTTERGDSSNLDTLLAGGIAEPGASRGLADHLVGTFRHAREVHHLYLDADRAYPPLSIHAQHLAEALGQPLDSPEFIRQWAFRPTRTLYEEWLKSFIALETRTATSYVARVREAQRQGTAPPRLEDVFAAYTSSVKDVLPHLTFVKADSEKRTIVFDSAGTEISFDNLSGGEREIAFLIGQIERFRLRTGILLLDEPELHLNPDLVRAWVAYLRDTVSEGQVWIATHSLEAVEVAGPASSFVLEREGDTRIVARADALAARPIIAALSGTLGSPAFSLSRLRFVYVEGERSTRERERFHMLVGEPSVNRFIEAGDGREVRRSVRVLRELADETGEPLRIGGVLDRDFLSPEQCTPLEAEHHVHVLGVHEIENLFLDPLTVAVMMERHGMNPSEAHAVIREVSDGFAGRWILHRAGHSLPGVDFRSEIRQAAGALRWSAVVTDREGTTRCLAQVHHDPSGVSAVEEALSSAADEYEALREAPDFWKSCLGKEVLSSLAPKIGLSNQVTVERSIAHLWTIKEAPVSAELEALRDYVQSL